MPSRRGWEEAFAEAAKAEADECLLPDHMSAEWDESEWTW